MHWRIECSIEQKDLQIRIIFVLVCAALWYFHNNIEHLGRILSNGQVVVFHCVREANFLEAIEQSADASNAPDDQNGDRRINKRPEQRAKADCRAVATGNELAHNIPETDRHQITADQED